MKVTANIDIDEQNIPEGDCAPWSPYSKGCKTCSSNDIVTKKFMQVKLYLAIKWHKIS